MRKRRGAGPPLARSWCGEELPQALQPCFPRFAALLPEAFEVKEGNPQLPFPGGQHLGLDQFHRCGSGALTAHDADAGWDLLQGFLYLHPAEMGQKAFEIRAIDLDQDLVCDVAPHPGEPVLQLQLVGKVVVIRRH